MLPMYLLSALTLLRVDPGFCCCDRDGSEFVDGITIPSKTGKGLLRRVPEVFDCWFESGSMPYAQVHYPFNKEVRRCWCLFAIVRCPALLCGDFGSPH
jgi:hypothetical protein